MKASSIKLFISAILSAGLLSCSSGGGDQVAGIGGSGYISTGTVTGFGSVFVNGVEFETDSSSFEVEDNIDATQSDLKIGMVVQVSGTINPDGITGNATFIHYSDDLEGPIASITENADLTEKTLSILGKSVVIHNADTVFEGTTYTALTVGNVIEISGFYDNNNILQASYVEFKSISSNANNIFEITGIINNLDPVNKTTFTVQGINIDAGAATLSELPNGLQDGLLVEIKGTFSGSTITAAEIEGDDSELVDDGNEVSIEGYITDHVPGISFKINGMPVDLTNANLALVPETLEMLNGIKVEVEGTISNNILLASKIESRSGNSEVSAVVDSVDIANKRLTVSVIAGEPSITVQLTTATLTEDELSENQLDLSLIAVNTDFVEVRGYESGAGTITATRVKRVTGEKTELQGVITDTVDNTSITILGVVFPVDASTEYENELEASITYAEFKSSITLGQSVISIDDALVDDTNPVGFADSVEIETP